MKWWNPEEVKGPVLSHAADGEQYFSMFPHIPLCIAHEGAGYWPDNQPIYLFVYLNLIYIPPSSVEHGAQGGLHAKHTTV